MRTFFLLTLSFLLISDLRHNALYKNKALAQTIPDNSLGSSSSAINSEIIKGKPSDRIDGGLHSGTNLFHSFQEFNVGTEKSVYFANPAGVQNILTRVTGSKPSNILGTLGVLGNANLFLMNPNGIIFGADAHLDLEGSFLATTASSINFANGAQFITKPAQQPLLAISVPTGLGFGTNPGSIVVQGTGIKPFGTPSSTEGLKIQPSQTISLVGGDIVFSGGIVTTLGGRIEVGSVVSADVVTLTQIDKGWSIGYEGVRNFGNITLNQQSTINASGNGGGDIQIFGNKVAIINGSQIEIDTSTNKNSGTLSIFSSDSLELAGASIDGRFPSGLYVVVIPGASGSGGTLKIKTEKLTVRDGATISNSTLGDGNGGDITIDSSTIKVIGTSELFSFPSSITVAAEPGSTGNSGNLMINTATLSVQAGGVISSAALGTGNGGNLTIKSTESVEISGKPELNGGSVFAGGGLPSRLSSRSRGSGNGGNLIVESKDINIFNDGIITTRGQGTGNAGTIKLSANSINLNNRGSITAAATTSGGGNINLSAQSLQLKNSNITATAGSSGNGGNIGINANTIVTLESNSISANAFQGQGGNIQINTQGIFRSPDSGITASSQLGIDGTVEIKTLGFDVKNTLTPFNSNLIDPEQTIAGSCLARRNVGRGRFVVTGKGGIAVNPESAIDDNWVLLSRPVTTTTSTHATHPTQVAATQEAASWKLGDNIVEAQGIVRTTDGRILLTSTPQTDSLESVKELTCQQTAENNS